jgi:hypothetical protein
MQRDQLLCLTQNVISCIVYTKHAVSTMYNCVFGMIFLVRKCALSLEIQMTYIYGEGGCETTNPGKPVHVVLTIINAVKPTCVCSF